MKKVILIITLTFIYLISYNTSIWFDFFDQSNPKVIYCNNNECSLERWINISWSWINDIEKNRKLSVYIQDVIRYVITFISILAVIYIIYAWFNILISSW